MAEVCLHIGAPKTATSWLQSALARNEATLRESGTLYPQSMRVGDAHHPLVCDLIDRYQDVPMGDIWFGDQPRGVAWQRLSEEMAAFGDGLQRVVISSELFFGQSAAIGEILEALKGRLAGHSIRVLVYLRRQDQWFSSFYNQDVKGIRQWPHSAYQFYQTHQALQSDYGALLAPWRAVFGPASILLRPFEPAQWPQGDILSDFCRALSLPALAAPGGGGNEGLGFHQLYLKQCLNRVGYPQGWNEEVVALLLRCCPEPPAGDTLFVNEALYRRYRDRWQGENDRLAAEYLAGRPLFLAPLPEQVRPDIYTVDRPTLAAVLARLTLALEAARPELRRLFARAAMIALSERNLWDLIDTAAKNTLVSWL